MSLASGVGSGSDEGVTLADVVERLKAIEDIVMPLQPIPDALNTLDDTVRDQRQQQVALNLALTRMQKQILDQQALNRPAQDLGQNRPTQDPGQNRAALNQGRAGAEDGDDGGDFLPTRNYGARSVRPSLCSLPLRACVRSGGSAPDLAVGRWIWASSAGSGRWPPDLGLPVFVAARASLLVARFVAGHHGGRCRGSPRLRRRGGRWPPDLGVGPPSAASRGLPPAVAGVLPSAVIAAHPRAACRPRPPQVAGFPLPSRGCCRLPSLRPILVVVAIAEVIDTFQLKISEDQLMSRCTKCNGRFIQKPLTLDEAIEASKGFQIIPSCLFNRNLEFWKCTDCNQLYWEGTQYHNAVQKFLSVCNISD
ncbi:hypothetical protein GUJ93_ZPchr0007g3291 [Zizania palustris]|uniref:Mut7-C RNAse domain-containing protein n=1 Tax=Zizania palustris TaxID=103762 RepID=A0A8J5T9V5_ZIZPA|nr:hypothetical protein GUJ93_ZPchr0007g3291 [Zizania palustris]